MWKLKKKLDTKNSALIKEYINGDPQWKVDLLGLLNLNLYKSSICSFFVLVYYGNFCIKPSIFKYIHIDHHR